MDKSFNAVRRRRILDSVELVTSPAKRESLLIDKIIELENSLSELQESYAEMLACFARAGNFLRGTKCEIAQY